MILSTADILACLGLVAAILGVQLVVTIDDPPGGADEGYLWYGVLEVARGRVPVRDFRSYEPGRYWVSLPFLMLGRGLPSIRVAATAMLGLGSLAMALMLRGSGHGWTVVAGSVVLVAAWAPIFQKRHDQAVLLAAAASLGWMVAAPSAMSFTAAGVAVGLAGVFGMNLGLYTGVAAALVLAIVISGPEADLATAAGWFAVGLAIGASPLGVTMIGARGFARALVRRRLVDTTRRGSTNLALPIPVPWRGPRRQIALTVGSIGARAAPLLFVVLPIGALVVIAAATFGPADWSHEHPALVAVAALTVPAWHHVTSRADIEHLSNVVALPLIGVLVFADTGAVPVTAALAGVAAITIVVAGPRHPRVQRHREPGLFVRRSVLGRRALWFRAADHALLCAALELYDDTTAERRWLAVPMTLWVLPFLGVRSAVYNSFCVYPASTEVQRSMIAEIVAAAPPVALVGLAALDGREDLRFSATHPLVWKYVCDEYESVDAATALPSSLRVLRRREGPVSRPIR